MTLPFLPEGEGRDLFIDIDRRIANLEGLIGKGLSHKDLVDTEDHKAFLKQDGSVPVTGTLDFTKSGQIKNARNRVLNVDIYNGPVRLNQDINQFEFDLGTITSDDIAEGTINLYYTQARQDDIEAFAFMMGNG